MLTRKLNMMSTYMYMYIYIYWLRHPPHTHTQTLLSPVSSPYQKLAEECVKYGVAVELFLCPTNYADVATLGHFVSTTGGELHYYQHFQVRDKMDFDPWIFLPTSFFMLCVFFSCHVLVNFSLPPSLPPSLSSLTDQQRWRPVA